jgi:DNA mismatch repair protein MSH6
MLQHKLFFVHLAPSGLSYMKGHPAHAGFPEISYGPMADKLVRAGYKVARVEQTETPQMLQERKKKCSRGNVPKAVNREVCSIMTLGTRTFCYLDDQTGILAETATDGNASSAIGPLLVIREILLDPSSNDEKMDVDGDHENDNDDDDQVQPVAEYGITVVDAVRGEISIGQFADDCLRSRMGTLLATFNPSEVCGTLP